MKRLTASKLGLFAACQYPWRDGVTWIEDRPNAATSRGHQVHKDLELALRGEFVSTPEVEWVREAPESPFDLPAECILTEHAIGWRSNDGCILELPNVDGREYPVPPPGEQWVFGTADVITETETEIRVIDWKTGKREFVTEAYHNEQLRFLAAAYVAAKPETRSKKTVRVELWFIGDEKFIDIAVPMLDGHLSELRSKIVGVNYASAEPNAGCRYCPARVNCPSITGALELRRRIPETLAEVRTNEDAAWLLGIKRLAERVSEHADNLVKDWARENGGVKLENGKVWKQSDSVYRTIDGRAALELARALGASDEELARCERESTRTVFRETGRAVSKG